VVQRAKEQHRVGRPVGKVKASRVADAGADPRHPDGILLQLADVQWHQVAVLDLVAERPQPQGIAARAAAEVRDQSGRGWEATPHDSIVRMYSS
jgi:hypothetical protein